MSMKPPSFRNAFTLVELVTVLALLALLGLAATTSVIDYGAWATRSALKSAAMDLFLNMQTARMSAVKENRPWAIVFGTSDPQAYYLCSANGDGNWATLNNNTIVEAVALRRYKHGIGFGAGSATHSATAPPGVLPSDFVSFHSNVVVFSPKGLPSTSGYCYLSNGKNEAYAVGAMTSGVIKMKRWNRTAWE